jgi:hypothetical protein
MKANGIIPDIVSWNGLLCDSMTNIERKEIVNQMCANGVVPNEKTLNTFLNFCRTREEVEDISSYIFNNGNVDFSSISLPPRLYSLNIDIKSIFESSVQNKEIVNNGFNNTGLIQEEDAESVKSIDDYDSSPYDSERENLFQWNQKLSNAHRSDKMKIFNEMKANGIIPDIVSWNNLLHYTMSYIERKEIINQMCANGIVPNENTLNTFLKFCRTKEEVEDISSFIINNGNVDFSSIFLPSKFDSLNIDIKSIFESSLQYKEIVNNGFNNTGLIQEEDAESIKSIDTYKSLPYGSEREIRFQWNQKLSNALLSDRMKIFNEMKANGIIPDIVSWNNLLKATMTYTERKEIINQMYTNGIVPNVNTVNILLIFCRTKEEEILSQWNQKLNNAPRSDKMKIFNEMKANGIIPDIVSWNGLLGEYNMTYIERKEIVNQMCANGIVPNEKTLNRFLEYCRTKEEVEDISSFIFNNGNVDFSSISLPSKFDSLNIDIKSIFESSVQNKEIVNNGFNNTALIQEENAESIKSIDAYKSLPYDSENEIRSLWNQKINNAPHSDKMKK